MNNVQGEAENRFHDSKPSSEQDGAHAAAPILSERDRQKLLFEWNATAAEYPRDKCVHQLFEAQVARSPEAVAVRCDGQALTYHQLNQRANQLAHSLQRLGVKPQEFVGVLLERSEAFVLATLGILKAGAVYVPLEPNTPPDRLAFIFADAGLRRVITNAARPTPRAASAAVDFLPWETLLAAPRPEASANPTVSGAATDVAYVMYTSGSTGTPKGVAVPHQAIVRLVCGPTYLPFDDRQTFLLLASVQFDASTLELWGALLHGSRLAVYQQSDLELAHLHALLTQHQVTCLWLTAALFNLVIEQRPEALRAVKYLLIGGEALSVKHVCLALPLLPDTQIINGYGPTEGTTFTTTYPIPRPLLPEVASIPIGRPIANTQVYILDAERQPVPVGVAGELYISGDGLARGYLNQAALTAEKFVPDPFRATPGARLYRTGDRCRYLPDGKIEFLGRLDHQVKLRGFRIELGEIEAVLSTHPDLHSAVVLLREDQPGNKFLAAYFVPRVAPSPTTATLREFLKTKLPDYMIPAAFVSLPALPLTPNGKINRHALPAPTDLNQLKDQTTFVRPRTDTERQLTAIWEEVLARHPIGTHDNFFTLGGHSLNAVRIVSRAHTVLRKELSVRSVIEFPTVAQLGEFADRLPPLAPEASPPSAAPEASPLSAPASMNQAQLWFLQQLDPESCAYNLAHQLRFRGPLNLSALVASLADLCQRHELLRARFESPDGNPICVITPAAPLDLSEIDLPQTPEELRSQELHRLAAAEISRPFDLARGPLFRCTLIRLAPQDHVLLLGCHHIIYDGWSTRILLEELFLRYQAHCHSPPPPLRSLPFQFAHFVAWQQQELSAEKTARAHSFWRNELAQVPTTFGLPFRLTTAGQTHRQQQHTLTLPAATTSALRQLAQHEGVTLFATLLASFQTLLFRYTGQNQFLLGVPFAGRPDGPAQDLIGYFVNSLPVKADFSHAPAFVECLHQLQDRLWQVQAQQHFPFEKLVTEFCPDRDATQNPLFQILVAFEDLRQSTFRLPELRVEVAEVTPTTAMFDLTLLLKDRGAEIECDFLFNSDRYDRSDICQLADHFAELVKSVQATPHRPVAALELLSPAERQRLLLDWSATAAEYPRDKCVHQLFEAQVARSPEAVAVRCDGQALTYHQLNQRANQLAHSLQRLGVKPQEFVGVLLERSEAFVLATLGILKAGAVYVPLEPNTPPDRLAFIFADAGLRRVITNAARPTPRAASAAVDFLPWETLLAAPRPEASANPTVSGAATDVAYVMYTSGSTGTPKGVAVPHQAIVRLVCGPTYLPFDDRQTFLLLASVQFDASTLELWGALLHGSRLAVYQQSDLELAHLHALLTQHQVTCLWLTAALFNLVIEQRPEALRAVKYLLIGGEALSVKHVCLALPLLPDTQIINGYGPTEGTTFTTTYPIPRSLPPEVASIPIGRPIANTQTYILDEHRQPVPVGVAGELYIGGDGLARGYLNQPELTAQKFVPDPFSNTPGARLYRTGDRCRYLPDGKIEFLGRLDHQVKLRGFRIELGEIEAVLSSHPDLHSAVVLLREDQPGNKFLAAYFVPRVAPSPTTATLREFLKTKLPDYMIPAAFVSLPALPLTPNGKINRHALPAPTDLNQLKDQTTFVRPRTDTERQLTAIWEEVLARHPIGTHDNFFTLGGHSLLATRVMARIAERCGIQLPLRLLFENPTVAGLSAELDQAQTRQSLETERLLQELEGLSDEEARRLLGE